MILIAQTKAEIERERPDRPAGDRELEAMRRACEVECMEAGFWAYMAHCAPTELLRELYEERFNVSYAVAQQMHVMYGIAEAVIKKGRKVKQLTNN